MAGSFLKKKAVADRDLWWGFSATAHGEGRERPGLLHGAVFQRYSWSVSAEVSVSRFFSDLLSALVHEHVEQLSA